MISSPNETKPDTPNVSSTSRRTSSDVGAAAGVAATATGSVALGAAASSTRRDNSSAPTATSRLTSRGDPERPRDAQLRNHPDAGDERTGDRAGGVAGVEQRDLPAEDRSPGDRGFTTRGSVAPIRVVGTTRTAKDKSESHEGDDDRPAVEEAVEADVQRFDAGERERRGQRGDGDAGLGCSEDDEGPPHAIGQAPGRRAPEREAGHERGEDRARGVDGDTEDQRQQAHPEHLVDEGADAGQEEEKEEWRQRRTGRPIRVRRGHSGNHKRGMPGRQRRSTIMSRYHDTGRSISIPFSDEPSRPYARADAPRARHA